MIQKLKDTYRHKGMRRRLVEQLENEGITDKNVLEAFREVPRHFFFESAFEEKAYENTAFPIGSNQTISQPYTVAFQTQLLNIKPMDKVLEIGTGSGFQASILAAMGARVFTIERIEQLYLSSKQVLSSFQFEHLHQFFGDGYLGLPDLAPFKQILVTAGSPKVPKALLSQLMLQGRCVIPVGQKTQVMYRITRSGLSDFSKENFGDFKFVPFLEGVKKNNLKDY